MRTDQVTGEQLVVLTLEFVRTISSRCNVSTDYVILWIRFVDLFCAVADDLYIDLLFYLANVKIDYHLFSNLSMNILYKLYAFSLGSLHCA